MQKKKKEAGSTTTLAQIGVARSPSQNKKTTHNHN
jgi:hypothetical protein